MSELKELKLYSPLQVEMVEEITPPKQPAV